MRFDCLHFVSKHESDVRVPNNYFKLRALIKWYLLQHEFRFCNIVTLRTGYFFPMFKFVVHFHIVIILESLLAIRTYYQTIFCHLKQHKTQNISTYFLGPKFACLHRKQLFTLFTVSFYLYFHVLHIIYFLLVSFVHFGSPFFSPLVVLHMVAI